MILLTGGSGFVGQRLVRHFLAQGRAVRVLSRGARPPAVPGAVQWAIGDLTDPSSLPAALAGVSAVIHLGSVVRGERGREPDFTSTNVSGTASLARAARVARVGTFIHVSSAGVYGDGVAEAPSRETDPLNPATAYERSKLAAEQALETVLHDCSMRRIILRPQGLYGSDRPATAQFFRQVARRRVWLHGPMRVLVHPTHVLDLIDVIVRSLARDDLHGEVLNVGGARPVEFRELIALVGTLMGTVPIQVSLPRWSGRLAGAAAGVWRLAGEPPARLQRAARRQITRAVNIDKTRRLLGFEPVPIEWGLGQTATELREQGLVNPGPES